MFSQILTGEIDIVRGVRYSRHNGASDDRNPRIRTTVEVCLTGIGIHSLLSQSRLEIFVASRTAGIRRQIL